MNINRTYRGYILRIAFGITVLALLLVGGAKAQTNVISSCTTISLPGEYVLDRDIIVSSNTSSSCIYINSSNVIFDGAGHTIDGVDKQPTTLGVSVYSPVTPATTPIVTKALTNTTVKNLKVTNWGTGIYYQNISDGSITDNTANSNYGDGISIYLSNNTNLTGNTANSNYEGIRIWYSNNNNLTNNTANSNFYGIELIISNNNNIIGNTANSNTEGISLGDSINNNITGNNIISNTEGIILWYFDSNNNIIYNNLFYNTNNFRIYDNLKNKWNLTKTAGTNIIGGPYLGGNFWAYPNGTGFSQTCTDADNDGICDLSYALDSNNTDYLPLASKPTPIPNQTFNISGFKVNDTNSDNIWNPGEIGIPDWNIMLLNATTGTQIASTSTDVQGFYEFTNVTPGVYNVTEEMKPGFVPSGATFKIVTIENMDVTDVDFLNHIVPPAVTNTISGFKINDLNGNGKQDAGENGLSGWKIRLIGIVGTGVDTKVIREETTTDSNGFYKFDNLSAGRYIINEVMQTGFIPVSSPVKNIQLAKGENSENNNFMNRPISNLIRW